MSAADAFRARDFLAPRYWPTWFGLGVLRLLVLLPFVWQVKLGGTLGALMYRALPKRRRIAEINIRLCFPDASPAAREQLVRGAFRSAAMAVFEGALGWWASDRRMRRLYRVEGLEHLEAARRLGKGVLLLGGHYTTLEISGRFMAYEIPDLRPTYKRARDPLFEAVMARSRRRYYDALLSSADMRAILRSLKEGKVCWYAPDQDFGRERSVFAPFLGVATATLTTTARIARASGAPVLPFYSERLPGAQGYLLRIGPALEAFPSGDDVQDATAINQAIEAQVRRTPEQYLWLHRRFKSRPHGEPDVYSPDLWSSGAPPPPTDSASDPAARD